MYGYYLQIKQSAVESHSIVYFRERILSCFMEWPLSYGIIAHQLTTLKLGRKHKYISHLAKLFSANESICAWVLLIIIYPLYCFLHNHLLLNEQLSPTDFLYSTSCLWLDKARECENRRESDVCFVVHDFPLMTKSWIFASNIPWNSVAVPPSSLFQFICFAYRIPCVQSRRNLRFRRVIKGVNGLRTSVFFPVGLRWWHSLFDEVYRGVERKDTGGKGRDPPRGPSSPIP